MVRLEATFEGTASDFSDHSRQDLAAAFAFALQLPLSDTAIGHARQAKMGGTGESARILNVPVRLQFAEDKADRLQSFKKLQNPVELADLVEKAVREHSLDFKHKSLFLSAPLSIRKELLDPRGQEDVLSQVSRVSLMTVFVFGVALLCFLHISGEFVSDMNSRISYHQVGRDKRNRSLADLENLEGYRNKNYGGSSEEGGV